ncbi:UvrD-helicase domain-containing protein [Bacteroidota bacterium]
MVLKIYRSSAGSGKTHKLTEEYLKLVFLNPDKFSRILAVTFTNKATEEMKKRILSELFKISSGNKSAHFETILNSFPQFDDIIVQQRAKDILQKILYNYSRFSVTTIDSFFQQIIKNFAREIGVQYGYNVELDTKRVIDQAVDLLFDSLVEHSQLQSWLAEFASDQLEEGKSWDLKNSIRQLVYEITKEAFQSNEIQIRQKLSDKDFLQKFIKQLHAVVYGFENRMSAIGKDALDSISAQGLSVDDFSYKSSGVAGYFQKLHAKSGFEPGNRAIAAIDNPEKWYAKSNSVDLISRIEQVVNSTLNDLLGSAVQLFENENSTYVSALAVKRYFYTLGILSDVAAQLAVIRDEENLMLISDVNQLLMQVIEDNDTPFIYEKTGNRYRHFLIDEFQDTSEFQWRNFLPLLKNSLDSNDFNLVVGDIKQSIYRWRGGDWKLLLTGINKEIDDQMIENVSLNQNWRSHEEVLQFNNKLFTHIPAILQEEFNHVLDEQDSTELHESLAFYKNILPEAFADVVQKMPDTAEKKGGFVQVSFFESDKEEEISWKDKALAQLQHKIEELLAVYDFRDMTILVRTKNEGVQIANYLMSETSYPVISKESLYLTASFSVRILLSALKFINDETDPINSVNLIVSLVGDEQKSERLSSLVRDDKSDDFILNYLPEGFNPLRLSTLNLYDLVEELVSLFQLNAKQNELAFIQAFQDVVLDYSRKNESDLSSFINWWDEFGKEKAIQVPDQLDAIEIMTVHKSKGLDFKVVLIPFCEWNLDHETSMDNLLWCKPSSSPFNELEVLPLKYQSELGKSLFAKEYFIEKISIALDNLNLLYVALTRAVEGLVLFSPASGREKIKKVSDVLHHVLSAEFEKWDHENNCFKTGLVRQERQLMSNSDNSAYKLNSYFSGSGNYKIRIRQDGKELFEKSGKKAKLNYGRLMHRLLSEIATVADVERVLDSYYFDGEINADEKEELRSKLTHSFKNVRIRDWFSDNYEVKNETPILIPGKEFKIPDRVLVKGQQAIVIDFKFGEEKQEHQQQVSEYRSFLKQMDYEPVEGYLWYVEKEIIRQV